MRDKPNHARKEAARAYQSAHPGTSYTRALRLVTETYRQPLTALLGQARDGSAVKANLEWESNGGSGPHCTVVGTCDEDTRAMLQHLGSGLAAGQQAGDLELITSASAPFYLKAGHIHWDTAQLGDLLADHLGARHRMLAALECADVEAARQAGHRIPSTVVLIAEPPAEQVQSGQLERWTRVGRSAGVSLVLGFQCLPMPVHSPDDALQLRRVRQLLTDRVGQAAAANMSATTIVHLGADRGRLIMDRGYIRGKRRGGSSTLFTMQRAHRPAARLVGPRPSNQQLNT